MRRLLIILCLFPATLAARSHGGFSIHVDDRELTDCNDLRVTIDEQPAARAEEAVPVSGLRSLVIHAPQNGGIHVVGSDSGRYEVKACKAAALDASLSDIRVRLNGNEVTADGPNEGRWVVYFLVRAPADATLEVSAHNGPISLRQLKGTITATTVNGPISLDGGSGTMKLTATNGPITVNLRGDTWNGTLDARTQNGPMSLRIPATFRSGVVVESDGHGPVSCHAEACRQTRRTWDDEDNRRIELGSGPAVVHLSTVNGPVSVRGLRTED